MDDTRDTIEIITPPKPREIWCYQTHDAGYWQECGTLFREVIE